MVLPDGELNMDYSAYEEKTILITGGAGCIGSNLSKKLSEYAGKIIILDNLDSAYQWNIPKAENIDFIQGDILDDEILKRVFKEKPEYIFHLAAHFANQNSVDNPRLDLMVNGVGILKVLQYAHLIGVERFIYSSSGCGVYGLDSKMPFEEHDISIYDLPIVNARFFNVFGPGEVPGKYRNVIPNFFYWSMNGQTLPITGNGTETRDWTYVEDIIDGLLAMGLVKEAIGEAINLGSGEETRVIDMANMVNELTENKEDIKYTSRRDWDVKTCLLSSIQKANEILDYKPQTKFNDGLKKTHEWFVTNWSNIKKSAEFDL